MGVKVIYVAGVPASGKSTLFKRLRKKYFDAATEFKFGRVRGIRQGQLQMLGVFDGSLFEGTDKLSMSVINDAIEYISELKNDSDKHVVFAEGDRLFNWRFISTTRATLLLLDANEAVLKQRHIMRGDSQSETFLRSRRTKVENYIKAHNTMRIWNNSPQDSDRIFNYLTKTVDEYVGK